MIGALPTLVVSEALILARLLSVNAASITGALGAAPTIEITKGCCANGGKASLNALTNPLNVPSVRGIPEITPVDVFSERPLGREDERRA